MQGDLPIAFFLKQSVLCVEAVSKKKFDQRTLASAKLFAVLLKNRRGANRIRVTCLSALINKFGKPWRPLETWDTHVVLWSAC